MPRQPTDNNDAWTQFADFADQSVYTGPATNPWLEHAVVAEPVFDMATRRTEDASIFDPAPFLKEYDTLREQAIGRGESGISGVAGVELLDIHRQRQGFEQLTPEPESAYEVQARWSSQANKNDLFRDIRKAPGGKIAGFGADIVGLGFPEEARKMRTRAEAYYGTPQSRAADIYGTTISTAAQIAALAGTGPAGFALAYGASGAGGVRTDIAELRAGGEEISGKQEAAAAFLTGGVEAASGLIGGYLFGRIAGKLSASIGGKITTKAIMAAFDKGGAKAVTKLVAKSAASLAPEIGAEAVEESVTQWLNNEIARATYDPERERFEGVVEAGLYGGFFAPFGGGVTRGIQGKGPAKESRKQTITRLEGELIAEQKESRTDELTKLGNRKQEKEDIKRIYSEADESGESVAVVETDIGNFKAVNDTLGHDVGDSVIRAAAESLQEAVRIEARRGSGRGDARPADTVHSVNRVGGDEFPVKLRGVDNVEAADAVMARAQAIFAEKVEAIVGDKLPAEALPFLAWGAEIRAPGDSRTPEQLTKAAEGRIAEQKARVKKDRGTPETREGLARLITDRQAEIDAEQQDVTVIPQDEVVDHIGENADKEAFRQLIEEAGEDFVEVEIMVGDFDIGAMSKQNLSEKKANEFAEMDAETAPPVVAFAGKDGLRVRDGRHRVVAAAMRDGAKQAGKVKAIVPRSWAESRGLIPKADAEEQVEPTGEDAENARKEQAALEPRQESESEAILRKREKLLPPEKRTKATEKQRKRVRDLLSRTGQAINRGAVEWLTTRGGRSDEWFRTKDRMRTEKNLTQHDIAVLLEKGRADFKEAGWDARNPADQRAVKSAINGEIPVSDLPKPLQDFVIQSRLALDAVSAEAVDLYDAVGLKKMARTMRGNLGTYLKAMFHDQSQGGMPKRALRLSNSFYKFKRDKHAVVGRDGRLVKKYETRAEALAHVEASSEKAGLQYVEPLTAEYRSEYQIDDPFYLVARSIAETKHNMEVVRLFHLAATNEAVPIPAGEDGQTRLEGQELADWAEAEGLVKLSGWGVYHELSGKYVPKVVAEDLAEVTNVPNAILRTIRAYERAFKESKTVLNPSTHGTNIIGNVMTFSWLDGNSPFNPVKFHRYYAPAWKHLHGKVSEMYRLALKHGVIRSDFVSIEITGLGDPGKGYDSMLHTRMRTVMGAPIRAARRVYELEDTWFKMSSFLRHMDRGMSPEEAAAAVDKSYPNYSHISKITKYIKKVPLLSPFISFADQAPKKVIHHARTPGGAIRIAAPFLMLQFLDELGKWGLDDAQRDLIDEAKSDSLLERQFQVVLPWIRNSRGAPVVWDIRNYIPVIRDVPTERDGKLTIPAVTGGPLVQTTLSQFGGVDQFTGYQFIQEDNSALENLAARGKQAFKTLAPIPSILQHGYAAVERAIDNGPQDTALAVLRQLSGIRVDTPYIKERHVRSIVEQMILADEFDDAVALVDTWNTQFRPLNLKTLNFRNLMAATDRQITAKFNTALEKAARANIGEDPAKAKAIMVEFNRTRKIGYEMTIEDIGWKAGVLRSQGVTRPRY